MRILIACEQSGVVRNAFRERGHDTWSCDILPAADGSEFHIRGDILKLRTGGFPVLDWNWEMVIAHPPCDDLCVSGARWFPEKRRDGRQQKSIEFFLRFTGLKCKWAIENPIGIMSNLYRKPHQIIQPWQFGHGETKATCLWLNGLPPLKPTNIVEGRENRIWKMGPSPERKRLRSITYTGIAKAMAEQWG